LDRFCYNSKTTYFHSDVIVCLLFTNTVIMLLSSAHRIFSHESLVRCQSISSCVTLNSQVCRLISQLGLRRRGRRSGNHVKLRIRPPAIPPITSPVASLEIPVVVENRMSTSDGAVALAVCKRQPPTHVSIPKQLIDTTTSSDRRSADQHQRTSQTPTAPPRHLLNADALSKPQAVEQFAADLSVSASPTLYVLNAAALSKPGAIEHLATDLQSTSAAIAVITETHFKQRHTDSVIGIDGYTVFRRDRTGRRGGGVALYVESTIHSTIWSPSWIDDNCAFELLWVRVGVGMFIAGLYHPPKPVYAAADLLKYIENCVGEVSHDYPLADIVLAGDLNQLQDEAIIERTGLTQVVRQPTRGANLLDRVFVSNPHLYTVVRVVTSVVKSDHKAVVAMANRTVAPISKTRQKRTFRLKTPSMNATFLRHLVTIDLGTRPDPDKLAQTPDPQAIFDSFYTLALGMLDEFYPERTITVTSRDPNYVTPEIKAKLRKKNRFMRAGRVEEAGALARQIGRDITRQTKHQLQQIDGKLDTKELWKAVRQLTGRENAPAADPSITAASLNSHYASVSSDVNYEQPLPKVTTAERQGWMHCVSDFEVFRILDTLRPTATGLDKLPAWFLRLAAPVFCGPIADLINLSLLTSTVPKQWKQARIRPVPKTPRPQQVSDYRPISITPVLSRITERIVVRRYIYPTLSSPLPTLQFVDQFAFRPTGSTTAAIISLLNTIINLLTTEPYVIVISLDFSKAFDTVRHSTLLQKLSQLDLPDHVHNWLTDFFSNHSHCTVFRDQQSSLLDITAGIIQGSAIGPAAYLITAGDLNATIPGNALCKFADDTYLIIPASNEHSRSTELANIQSWAMLNNLKLNSNKSSEIIFTDNRRRRRDISGPELLPGIVRSHSLKILGVDIADDFSVTEYVRRLTTSSAQTIYALRVLRSHGLNDADLQQVYRSTVVARLTYAACAWRGLMKASDRQRINLVIDRARRQGYCSPDLPTFDELCETADNKLIDKIMRQPKHVLHKLLPPPSSASQRYNLRQRGHSLQLPKHSTHLSDCNFLTRVLYRDAY